MTLFEKFQNTYPNDWLEISQSLAGAIVANDSKQMEVLIAKYFSSAATLKLLEGTIAFDFISYQQNQSECLVSAPAFLAVRSNKQNVLAEILKATKNPNARMMSENSGTLLMVSAECGNEEATKYLLSIGANPNSSYKNDDGIKITALLLSIANNHQNITELLLEKGAEFNVNELLMTIEIEDNLSIFYTELIESRISILSEGGFNNKRTPLHHACGQGKYLIVDWLINHGAKVDALDGESNTPLFYSSSQEFNSISELLIANGADPLLSRQGVENSLKIQLHEKEQELEALKNNYDKNIEDAKPIEITAIIERLELLEDKLGVRFEGVYCSQIKRSWEIPVDYVIEANFDVIGTGEILNRSFSPTLSAYNVSGQLLNTSTSFINNDRFLGIESIKIQMVCAEAPTRLRLYPANPI